MSPCVEHRDPVRHREGFVLVVRHEDEGDADDALETLELDLHLLAKLEVESTERLVEEEHARTVDERPGQGDSLTLAAGELGRTSVAVSRQTDRLQGLLGTAPSLRGGDLAYAQAVLDVFLHRQVREERVVLEDGVDVTLEGRALGHVDTVEQDLAARGQLEAGDHPQDGRLARAGRPEQGQELTVRDVQVDSGDGQDLAERLHQAAQAHRRAWGGHGR